MQLGATVLTGGRCHFGVWAPHSERVSVRVLGPRPQTVPLQQAGRGYHRATVGGVAPGSLYMYRLADGRELPDPASRLQPRGVHGPSQVVDPAAFRWTDRHWHGLPWREYILYELHVGTFTPQGTFDAVIPHLPALRRLGVTAVELMPVAQFPGGRNWGYDGVYPFAAQNSYGGLPGLQRLVDACHRHGLAVVLDVVYNHLGPEGNYLGAYGPYFSRRYQTPWGPALNFDGPHSDEVRRYFIANALWWLGECHVDALRLDAIHGILDTSARPFLAELAAAVQEEGDRRNRRLYLIAESDLGDPRVIRPPAVGGLGLDAQWNDDFHHALHTVLTGERGGYYRDFGRLEHLARAFGTGYVYTGQYSDFRQRRHGAPPDLADGSRLVVYSQNHDQVGNRMAGERLSCLVPLAQLKLAAALVLLSPFVPLLFMGEEYGETAPFQYFISHSDPELVAAVRRGRRAEFAAFGWDDDLDPQDEATFQRSRLQHHLRRRGQNRMLLRFYRTLLRLRRETPALAHLSLADLAVAADPACRTLTLRRWHGRSQACAVFNFAPEPAAVAVDLPAGRWQKRLDSADRRWQGPGSAVPDLLTSGGTGAVTLVPAGESVFLLVREEEGS